MKSKIKCKFSKKIWRLKEEFKTSNRRSKKVAGYKKAIVTIKKGQNIDLTSGI